MATVSINPLMLSFVATPEEMHLEREPKKSIVKGDKVSLSLSTPVEASMDGFVCAVSAAPAGARVICVAVRAIRARVDGDGVEERHKAIMRRQIVPIALVTFRAIDGSLMAITASSVRALKPGCFVFNIQVSSSRDLPRDAIPRLTRHPPTRCSPETPIPRLSPHPYPPTPAWHRRIIPLQALRSPAVWDSGAASTSCAAATRSWQSTT